LGRHKATLEKNTKFFSIISWWLDIIRVKIWNITKELVVISHSTLSLIFFQKMKTIKHGQ
jgi:hypothetical protein